MSGAVHGLARRWWAGELGLPGRVLDTVAAPAEWLYAAASRRDLQAKAARQVRVDGLQVVSVGNLVVGGTGKTPVAAWLCRALQDAGRSVALVSRGYGRDEGLLHRRWNPHVPVVVDPDRVAGARTARAQGADTVVLDDGFQHRRLTRDVDLVLLAAEDPFPGRLLPRGPYREPAQALERATAVVVTRRTATAQEAETLASRVREGAPHLEVAVAAFAPGHWQDLAGRNVPAPEGPLVAAAAVARPEAFATQLAGLTGTEPRLLAFPDHHEFTEDDVKALRARAGMRTVVVTEKDAVKLQPYASALDPVRVLTQNLRWEAGEAMVTRLVTAREQRGA